MDLSFQSWEIYSEVILVYIYCYSPLPEEDYAFPVRLAAQTCDNWKQ